MKTEMKFSKIKLAEKVELEWLAEGGGDAVTSTLSSEQTPAEEFKAAMLSLKPEMLKLLDIPKTWGNNIEVRQVTIQYLPDGEMKGITISAVKPIANSNKPLNLSTPSIRAEVAKAQGKVLEMSPRMIGSVDELIEQARLFVEARRADSGVQLGLFTPSQSSTNGTHQHTNDAATERRIRCALMEIAPDVEPGAEIDNDNLREAVAQRWEDVNYKDVEALEKKDIEWPGIHRHHFKDEDGEGDVYCAVQVTYDGVGQLLNIRFWYDIAPDLFEPTQLIQQAILGPEILPIYRELLHLPQAEAVLAGSQQ